MTEQKAKIILKVDDDLWKQVVIFKAEKMVRNNNEAVLTLVRIGLNRVKDLQPYDKVEA